MLFPPHLRLSKILEARKKKKKEKLGGSDDSSSFSFLKFENARRGKREAALGLNAEKWKMKSTRKLREKYKAGRGEEKPHTESLASSFVLNELALALEQWLNLL